MHKRFQWSWLGVLLGLGVGIALLLTLPEAGISQATVAELRGVWLTNVDSNVLFSRSQLRQGLQRLQSLNFNTIYPTVWNWGYTLYPSDVAATVLGEAVAPTPALQKRDMLAEAIELGHRRRLAVIPWFEFGFMAPDPDDPDPDPTAPSPSQLAAQRRHWLTQRQDQTQIFQEGRHRRVWLNPFHPEVEQFMTALIAEMVSRYDLDGIQFDDHLGLPVELGYDPFTVALYQQEHQNQSPPVDYRDPDWVRWRAEKLTAVMTRLVHTVKALKPHCLISLSPNPYDFAYQEYLQDWQTWIDKGLIDELIIQVYRGTLDSFNQELGRTSVQLAREKTTVGIGILTGLKQRPVAMDVITQQVAATRAAKLAGVSFFFYESLGNRDTAFRNLFNEPATRPQFPEVSKASP